MFGKKKQQEPDESQKIIQKLTMENTQLEQKIKDLEQQNEAANQQNLLITRQYTTTSQRLDKLQKENREKDSLIDSLNNQLSQQEDKIKELGKPQAGGAGQAAQENDEQVSKEKYEELMEELNDTAQQLDQAYEENDELKSRLESSEKRRNEEIEKLQQ